MRAKFAQRGEAELCNRTSVLMMRYHTCIVQYWLIGCYCKKACGNENGCGNEVLISRKMDEISVIYPTGVDTFHLI
jgi:hypothetical protein